jgi:hypothetical protein
VVRQLFQIEVRPDSSIFSYEQEGRRNHLEFVQKFFSYLINDAGTIGPVLEKSFIIFYLDAKSTVEELGRLKVLIFKTGGFLNYRATR